MVQSLVLGQTRQRFEDAVVVWIVGVVLDLRQGEELGTRGGGVGGGFSEIYFSGRLREGDGVIERGVGARGRGHPGEPWRGLQHARLQRGEGAGARLGAGVWAEPRPRVLPAPLPRPRLHQAGVLARPRVEAARVVVPRVPGQPLVHQLVRAGVASVAGVRGHLVLPVVLRGGAADVGQHRGRAHAHPGRRARARGHDGRPLVRPVRVLLHVLGQVGLLGVALAAVGADVRLQMLGLLVLGDVLQQRGLVVETLVAGVTFVWLVRLVTPGVGLQVGQLGEGLRATYNFKLKHGIKPP